MIGGPDRNEIEHGRRVIRTWPRREIESCAKLPPDEQAVIVLGAALLNMRPGLPEMNPADVIEIDWR